MILLVFLAAPILSASIDRNCPNSHPYAYLSGSYCCKSGLDWHGLPIVRDVSVSCREHEYTICSHRSGCNNSPKLQSEECPQDYPFVYLAGRYCCQSAYTWHNKYIDFHSESCRKHAYTLCQYGSFCKNHESLSDENAAEVTEIINSIEVKEHWESLQTCDATHIALTCESDLSVGLSKTEESSTDFSTEVRIMTSLEIAFGVSVGGDVYGGSVSSEVRAKLEVETTNGISWTTASSETFTNEHMMKLSFAVEKGKIYTICQLITNFGPLRIGTPYFKPVEGTDCSVQAVVEDCTEVEDCSNAL